MENFENIENFEDKEFREYGGECGDFDKSQSSEELESTHTLLDKCVGDEDDTQKLGEVESENSRSLCEYPIPLMEPLDKMAKEQWALLPPDHPLLQKFQKLLNEHLVRTKEKLTLEVAEMRYQTRLKTRQREELGVKLYGMQQDLVTQNEHLEQYAHDMKDYILKRQAEEQAVTDLRKDYEQKTSLKKTLKSQNNKRMMELESLQGLEENIRKWAEDVEDEVKNAKRAVSRGAQLQKKLSEDKRKSDMLFFHLDVEVKKRETELQGLHEEMADIRDVIDSLNTSISNANTDLETLEDEHKRLTQAWGEVIVAIAHRDKILHSLNVAINKEKESIKLNSASIDAIKKQVRREMATTEKLEAFKSRLAHDFLNLERDCHKEAQVLKLLEVKLEELPQWLERTEKDLHEAKKEGNTLENEIRRIQWRIEKQYNKKFAMEESILKLAQEQLITDKASEYRLKLLNKSQEQRRSMELALAQSQRQLAEILLELEALKNELVKMRQGVDEQEDKVIVVEAKSKNLSSELKTLQTQIDIKLKKIDRLAHQLDDMLRATETVDNSSTPMKIKALEKALLAAEQQIREHQQFWLMLQNHYVNLSQKRNNQLNEIQVTRKQLSIIKQKSLKIDQDLEKSEKRSRDLIRDMQAYQSKIGLLNAKLAKKRIKHEVEEADCEVHHATLLQRLKDHELEILEIEAEITELNNEIDHYKDLVADKHRDALAWETKYKMIEETLRWSKEERSTDSEIGTMKAEIHRMQLRYNQIKRAQEKLVVEFEHCVVHREQVFILAYTKSKTQIRPGQSKSSLSTQQKVLELRTKLKHIHKETDFLAKHEINAIENEQAELRKEIDDVRVEIDQEHKQNELVCEEIHDGLLKKHINLEQIVRKQNRAKSYRKFLLTSAPPKITRTDISIHEQMEKLQQTNKNLIRAIHTFMIEFPEKKELFIKILETLKE